jgi:uncharacterized RDD family membrane protein YckC
MAMDGPAPGVRFAGHGGRLVAYIIDTFIVGLVLGLAAVVLTFLGIGAAATGSGAAAGAAIGGALLYLALAFVLLLVYFPWFWSRGGQTPGMKLFRLRVVRDADGGPVGVGAAIIRLIGYWIDSIVFGIPIGFIWILVDKRRRGWHDIIAGTCVVEA